MHECNWCGENCDESFQAIRHFKTIFITNGVVESGEASQDPMFFCNKAHRNIYFVGL